MNIVNLEDIQVRVSERTILKDINFQMKKGENWAILGLNGSGKTSLVQLIAGYKWPTSGKVQVLGETFGQCYLPEVRKRIGWVSDRLDEFYQELPYETVFTSVLSGKTATFGIHEDGPTEDEEKAKAIIEKFGLSHLLNSRILTLSQGERKRAYIARAWMADSELLILDEPCAGLDFQAKENLLPLINQFGKKDHSLLYVTHHTEEIVPAITHVLLMKDGQIIAQGPKKEVLTEENIEEAFTIPVHVRWEDERIWISPKEKMI